MKLLKMYKQIDGSMDSKQPWQFLCGGKAVDLNETLGPLSHKFKNKFLVFQVVGRTVPRQPIANRKASQVSTDTNAAPTYGAISNPILSQIDVYQGSQFPSVNGEAKRKGAVHSLSAMILQATCVRAICALYYRQFLTISNSHLVIYIGYFSSIGSRTTSDVRR